MNWQERIDNLKKYLNYNPAKGHIRHNMEGAFSLVPFKTRGDDKIDSRTILESVGEFSRLVAKKTLKKKIDPEEICREILSDSRIEYEDRELKEKFKKVIQLSLNQNLKDETVKSPYFLKFLNIEGKEKKVRDIAAYTYRNLYLDSEITKSFFRDKGSKNLITRLTGELLEKRLEEIQEKEEYSSKFLFPSLIEKFNEDMMFLTGHPEYFLKNMGYFFNYYLMIYIYQIIYNINHADKGNFEEISQIYFAVDLENTSGKRKSHTQGYKYFRESVIKTYYHMNALEHIGVMFGEKGSLYHELEEKYNTIDPSELDWFSMAVNSWMETYKEVNRAEKRYVHEPHHTFKEFYKGYVSLIEAAHISREKKGTYLRYTACIEEIAKENFLKARGSLGYTLNLTQNFLLFITALAVKDKQKQVKELFKEIEERGIYLDRNSKEKVLEILEKNNLIEKKSDGGEVQYVKPVL